MILNSSQALAVLNTAAQMNDVGGTVCTMSMRKGENRVSVTLVFDAKATVITTREYDSRDVFVAHEDFFFMIDFTNAYGFE